MYEEDRPEAMHYERGFPLGFTAAPKDTKRYYIFNHIAFLISYHQVRGAAEAERAVMASWRASWQQEGKASQLSPTTHTPLLSPATCPRLPLARRRTARSAGCRW